ncbi:MAG: hypothetical protein IKY98_05995 [Alphaproteobacteria bacterium]|nr:hypothetical protein [Alphaproteobacteria bacterium]
MEFQLNSPFFSADELRQIDAVFSVEYNFDTPVLSAVFKPKMDNITDENWNSCMNILHDYLPLKETQKDGMICYEPFYEDVDAWNKSLEVLLALKNCQKQEKKTEDEYYYGSQSNKIMHMEVLNRYFDVVRFPVNGEGVWQYALEPITENAKVTGKRILSEYMSIREIKIKGVVYYDALEDKSWPFFYKIASDLEDYQKQLMIENKSHWKPVQIGTDGRRYTRSHSSHIRD